jgi:hypothetical protein
MSEITNNQGSKRARLLVRVIVVSVLIFVAFKAVEFTRCPENGFARAVQVNEGISDELKGERGEWAALLVPLRNRGTPFGKDGLKIFNSISYRDCSVERKWRAVIRYVEIRDSRLGTLTDGKDRLVGQQGEYFRRAKFGDDREKSNPDREGFWWHFSRLLIETNPDKALPKPQWVSTNALSQETFIGFLGEGWLFKGSVNDQFYWVTSQ